MLALVLTTTVFVRSAADFIALKEKDLSAALASINFDWQWGGIGKLQGDITFPLGLKGRDVDDDSATRIGTLAYANGLHIARDLEILHRSCQGEGIRGDDADIALEIDK